MSKAIPRIAFVSAMSGGGKTTAACEMCIRDRPKTYPVGMVNLLDIAPMTFDEFLEATKPQLFSYYETISKDRTIEEIFHSKLLEAYNNYIIIGGIDVYKRQA